MVQEKESVQIYRWKTQTQREKPSSPPSHEQLVVEKGFESSSLIMTWFSEHSNVFSLLCFGTFLAGTAVLRHQWCKGSCGRMRLYLWILRWGNTARIYLYEVPAVSPPWYLFVLGSKTARCDVCTVLSTDDYEHGYVLSFSAQWTLWPPQTHCLTDNITFLNFFSTANDDLSPWHCRCDNDAIWQSARLHI